MTDVQSDMRHRMLLRAVRSSPLGVFWQDANLVYRWVESSRFGWLTESIVGKSDHDIFSEETAAKAIAAKRLAMETGQRQRYEFSTDEGSERSWFEVSIEPVDGSAGEGGVICWALDITDRMRKEVVLKTLLREVSHRSRNLLAMVLSISTQTGRSSTTIGQFVHRFAGRIQSMAKSQDIITDSDWRGATMEELVRRQVTGISEGFIGRIRYSGEAIDLPPNAALHIGLALHELATNAMSHGALSGTAGSVRIATVLAERNGVPHVEISWTEIDGPRILDKPKKNFGSVTLERIVPSAVGGKGSLDFGSGGLTYRLTFPAP